MRVKKFLARTLPEAMAQVKAELGADAVILHTRTVKVGGIFGLFSARMIEVTAAAEEAEQRIAVDAREQPVAPATAPRPLAAPGAPGLLPAQQAAAARATGLSPAPAQLLPMGTAPQPQPVPSLRTEPSRSTDSATALRDDMADMKAMISQLMEQVASPMANIGGQLEPELKALLNTLSDVGVCDEAAMYLMTRVRSRILQGSGHWGEVMAVARDLMRQDLGKVEAMATGRRTIALVGPTGVGKTTTLAKLAAHFALGQRKQVALITADTYRVSAVEQLRTYSEILGLPLEVVYDPSELPGAVSRHQHRDLVLVDTAGRSPRNMIHMGELQTYLKVLAPDEVYLVMSITSSYKDAMQIVDRHLQLGFDRFLFTKWDEATSPGLIYSMVYKYKRPLSYITMGQNVPDDIEIAHPDKITRAILGD